MEQILLRPFVCRLIKAIMANKLFSASVAAQAYALCALKEINIEKKVVVSIPQVYIGMQMECTSLPHVFSCLSSMLRTSKGQWHHICTTKDGLSVVVVPVDFRHQSPRLQKQRAKLPMNTLILCGTSGYSSRNLSFH